MYSVTSLTATTATLSSSPIAGCLAPGDEILLINLQGTSSYYTNVGNYEFLCVANVIGDLVVFQTAKVNFYGNNSDDDANIGTAKTNQRVVLQRVPNYDDLAIYGTLTGNQWNNSDYTSGGTMFGVIVFRVYGTMSGNGIISADSLGFHGGWRGSYPGGYNPEYNFRGYQGETYGGIGTISADPYLGGAGGGGGSWSRGGGGEYGGGATNATWQSPGSAGNTYGLRSIVKLFLGSGGGGGGALRVRRGGAGRLRHAPARARAGGGLPGHRAHRPAAVLGGGGR